MTTEATSFVPSTDKKVEEPKPQPKEKGIEAIEKLVEDSKAEAKEAEDDSAKDMEDEKTEEKETDKDEKKDPADVVKVLSEVFESIKKEKADGEKEKISVAKMKDFISNIGCLKALPIDMKKDCVSEGVLNREQGVDKILPKPDFTRKPKPMQRGNDQKHNKPRGPGGPHKNNSWVQPMDPARL